MIRYPRHPPPKFFLLGFRQFPGPDRAGVEGTCPMPPVAALLAADTARRLPVPYPTTETLKGETATLPADSVGSVKSRLFSLL